MARLTDIKEKLDFADQKHQEFCNLVFSAAGGEVKFLSSIAGDILASSRECFDYCANDIFETFIEPKVKFPEGKPHVYYPFFKNQLIKRNGGLGALEELNQPLREHLFSIVAQIEKKTERKGTNLNLGILEDLNKMVNQKKHDKLLPTVPHSKPMIYAESPQMKLMVPISEQKGISRIQLSEDMKHTLGNQYIFKFNSKDVMTFTMQAKNLTRMIIQEIYEKYFQL
jgi:hypothetical protein